MTHWGKVIWRSCSNSIRKEDNIIVEKFYRNYIIHTMSDNIKVYFLKYCFGKPVLHSVYAYANELKTIMKSIMKDPKFIEFLPYDVDVKKYT